MSWINRMLGNWLGERLRVELRPSSVVLTTYARYPVARLLSTRTLPVEAAEIVDERPAEPWRASLDALAAGLRERRGVPGRVDVVLSDSFVRYALLPWSESLVGNNERTAFARLTFREIYGPLADGWDFSVDEQPAGQACFGCAIDRDLLAGLRDSISLAGGRLDSVLPGLADCFNRHRRAIAETEFCLAVAERGRVSLAFRGRSGWQAVRSRRIDGSLSDVLPTLLKQEAAAGSSLGSGTLYLCVANADESGPTAVQGWKVLRLNDQSKPALASERQPSTAGDELPVEWERAR